jgi:hypothetical protein
VTKRASYFEAERVKRAKVARVSGPSWQKPQEVSRLFVVFKKEESDLEMLACDVKRSEKRSEIERRCSNQRSLSQTRK